MVISHLNVLLDFIKFSEFDILVGILVNDPPVNNFDRIFFIRSAIPHQMILHSPPVK